MHACFTDRWHNTFITGGCILSPLRMKRLRKIFVIVLGIAEFLIHFSVQCVFQDDRHPIPHDRIDIGAIFDMDIVSLLWQRTSRFYQDHRQYPADYWFA